MLNNSHYLRLLYTPDPLKAEKEEAFDKRSLQALEKALTEEEKKTIRDLVVAQTSRKSLKPRSTSNTHSC